jgi:hypothetical protein
MIVRILGEGQFSVPDELGADLDRLDGELEAAVERGDEPTFRAALDSLLSTVREQGTEAPADNLEPSELILPHEGSSMDEVRQLLSDDGVSHA